MSDRDETKRVKRPAYDRATAFTRGGIAILLCAVSGATCSQGCFLGTAVFDGGPGWNGMLGWSAGFWLVSALTASFASRINRHTGPLATVAAATMFFASALGAMAAAIPQSVGARILAHRCEHQANAAACVALARLEDMARMDEARVSRLLLAACTEGSCAACEMAARQDQANCRVPMMAACGIGGCEPGAE